MQNKLTVKQVQQRLGVSHTAVLKWIYKGKLRATFDGFPQTWKIKESDLEKFLRQRDVQKSPKR